MSPDVQTKVARHWDSGVTSRKGKERREIIVSDDCTVYGTKGRKGPVTRNGNRGARLDATRHQNASHDRMKSTRTLWKSRRAATRASHFTASRGLV